MRRWATTKCARQTRCRSSGPSLRLSSCTRTTMRKTGDQRKGTPHRSKGGKVNGICGGAKRRDASLEGASSRRASSSSRCLFSSRLISWSVCKVCELRESNHKLLTWKLCKRWRNMICRNLFIRRNESRILILGLKIVRLFHFADSFRSIRSFLSILVYFVYHHENHSDDLLIIYTI